MSPSPIFVLLFDDQPLLRTTLRTLLASTHDLHFVAAVKSFTELAKLPERAQIRIILFSNRSNPHQSLSEITVQLHSYCPSARIIALFSENNSLCMEDILQPNLDGGMLREELSENIIHVLHAVSEGESWFSRQVIERISANLEKTENKKIDSSIFTLRERAILPLLAQGFENAQIATELDLAQQTVRNLMTNLYAKLGVSTRSEAILRLRQ